MEQTAESIRFGRKTLREAVKLADRGRDPNQTANILCREDPKGSNYGIGIILDGRNKPIASSPTLIDYAVREFKDSTSASYMNSVAKGEAFKAAVLAWQRVPKEYWDHFLVALPSDGGTGAVYTGCAVAVMQNPGLQVMGIEEHGWPAYKAIAKVIRVECREFPGETAMSGDDLLPVYQAGPVNSTGTVPAASLMSGRARSAARLDRFVLLDRAYPGFEYAAGGMSYDELMRRSFAEQVLPFMEEGVTFALAVSLTKAFATFSLRPAGLLMLYCPDRRRKGRVVSCLNQAIRARGSFFEHPMTRAMVKAVIEARPALEAEHEAVLGRIAASEGMWRRLSKGSPIEHLFSEGRAGLFRNARCTDDAPEHIYDEHLYPVFPQKGRCRLNVTGLPVDEELARRHVERFAAYLS